MFYNKNKKSILFRDIIVLFCFVLLSPLHLVKAGSVDFQRCQPDTACLLGEYVFNDDGTPVGQQACIINIKNPSGGTVVNDEDMNFESDGWQSYSFLSSGPEGLYRSLMCCTVGSDSACLDKSFVLGTSLESLNDIQSDTQLIRSSTFDFSGFADAGSSDSTLVDAELSGADDYWNNYTLEMITGDNTGETRNVTSFDSASHTLSFLAFSQAINAGEKYVLRHDSRLIFGIWNYANRTLTSATNIAGDIWSSSTRTLSSFGSLTSDIWSNTFAPTRTLTSKSLSGGENLSTESNSETLKDELMTEIGTVEVNIATTDAKVDEIIVDTASIEAKLDLLNVTDSGTSELMAKWGDYDAEELASKLDNIYNQVKEISNEDIDDKLSSLNEKVNENLDEAKSLQNKAIEIKAMIALNRSLIEKKPTVKTFYEWGSVVLKMVAANPSETKQTIDFRAALPREIKPEDVINKSDDLRLEFDAENDLWFASASVELASKESETKFVEVRDIWKISDEEIESLRRESEDLSKPLEKTGFYAQSVTIQNDISARLDKIKVVQSQDSITPEEHILNYRENKIEIETIKKNIESLKSLVGDIGNANSFKGSLLGVSTTMTWSIMLVVIFGVGILLAFLVIALRGRNVEIYEKNRRVDFENSQNDIAKNEKSSTLLDKRIFLKRVALDAFIFVLCLALLWVIFFLYKNKEIFSKNKTAQVVISNEE